MLNTQPRTHSLRAMSDPFFVTATRKRKKPPTASDKKSALKRTKQRGHLATNGKNDDEGSSEDDFGPGNIDDMELRGSEGEDEEEITETAAEKRIRLAKKYIEGIKESIGTVSATM